MEYKEMTAAEVKKCCRSLSEEILQTGYNPDLVVFIAKGAFQIGKIISENFDCPMVEINCSRKGSKLKNALSPFFKLIPSGLKAMLREKEMNNLSKKADSERTAEYDVVSWSKHDSAKRILLVDDSIDSGYSMRAAYDCVKEYFAGAEVRIAVINEFEGSEKVISSDYCLLQNTLISGPWSADSKEHKRFIARYEEWKKQERKNETADA
ncbi:MAG: phosphoribosyltransferase [Lachnospiraceae bacterium]|nr:phosphoribosyltransferase [Lachnospiraceae bacterium]